MSAILGSYIRDGEPIDSGAFDEMMFSLADYGKDRSSRWIDGFIALGHLATWVSPESQAEKLPYRDSESGLVITADARIDDRDWLCSALDLDQPSGLRSSPKTATTSSGLHVEPSLHDSQLILKAYQKWGRKCPRYLTGDFAFAIWDARERLLFCARDVLGVRPFYYHLSASRFVLASDMCALLKVPGIGHDLDASYVSAHFRRWGNYPDATHTWYESIKKLAPASALVVDASGVQSWSYWNPSDAPEVRFRTSDEYSAALRDLLRQSVHDRVRSADLVGAHLSGGLDSSSVAVLAARQLHERGGRLVGFSWAPPPPIGEPQHERAMVEQLCRLEHIPVHYTQADVTDQVASRLRNPGKQRDAGFLHEVVVRRTAAAEGIRCILSGWGGDELITFNGRGYFAELLRRGRWLRLWRESRAAIEVADGGAAIWKWIIARGVLPLLPDWVLERFYAKALPALWRDAPIPTVFVDEFLEELRNAESLPKKRGRERSGVRDQQLSLLAYGHLTERIEGWAAAGGRRGITYAYPLLDRRIVEFALGLPPEMYFKNGWKRFLFREAMSGILPDEVRWERSKREPALNADRERIGRGTHAHLAGIVDGLLKEPRTYRILDASRTRRHLGETLSADQDARERLPDRRRPVQEQGDVIGAFLVELLLNEDLAHALRDCVQRE